METECVRDDVGLQKLTSRMLRANLAVFGVDGLEAVSSGKQRCKGVWVMGKQVVEWWNGGTADAGKMVREVGGSGRVLGYIPVKRGMYAVRYEVMRMRRTTSQP